MNLPGEKTSRTSQQDMDWRGQRTCSLLPVAGKVFLLTLPFIERGNPTCGFRHLRREVSLFKYRMISREPSSEFFAKGRIPDDFLEFADVDLLGLLSIFPSLDGTGSFPLCFEEQCT